MATQNKNQLDFNLLRGDSIEHEVAGNQQLRAEDLRAKVEQGRAKQQRLTTRIRDLRLAGNYEDVLRLSEQRRLYHISTILARAELLTRAGEETCSKYAGDEAKVDDLTILERARSFLETELEHTNTEQAHQVVMDRLSALEHVEHLVERANYDVA
jgi:hypothetical protein